MRLAQHGDAAYEPDQMIISAHPAATHEADDAWSAPGAGAVSGVFTRMATDPRTMAYVARRTAEGKTTKEIIRCLKRYVAREVYKALTGPHPAVGQHPHPKSFMTT